MSVHQDKGADPLATTKQQPAANEGAQRSLLPFRPHNFRAVVRVAPPFASVTQAAPAKPRDATVSTAPPSSSSSSASPPAGADKPAHDVVAGAMARAASQGTIHPLDTMKVRMQAGSYKAKPSASGHPSSPAVSSATTAPAAAAAAAAAGGSQSLQSSLRRGLTEVASLYKGVLSAATGAGVIIGAYFAFYSTSKRYLRQHTEMPDGQVAFMSGAIAAVGSSVVKVPIAVCIRSVQAGVYPNVMVAAKSIVGAAGPQGLFTGFLPTLMEDVPDMAVKFAVYETLRPVHYQMSGGRQPSTLEDLLMGGSAGAAAAAATTPLDVVKTRMMCSASSRPSFAGAIRSVLAEGEGFKAFFRGVGPRALSNGINSAVFFCFFEAIRRVLVARQEEAAAAAEKAGLLGQQAAAAGAPPARLLHNQQQQRLLAAAEQDVQAGWQQQASLAASNLAANSSRRRGAAGSSSSSSDSRLACLSLAIPLPLLGH